MHWGQVMGLWSTFLQVSPSLLQGQKLLQFRELGAKCKYLMKGCLTRRILCGLYRTVGKGVVDETQVTIIPWECLMDFVEGK